MSDLSAAPRRILVLGYGNPLRGDDGLGWHAARLLEAHPWDPATTVQVHACHQLTPELAALLAAFDLAIFIDARQPAAPPTAVPHPAPVQCVRLEAAEPAAWRLSHHLTPAALLRCARELYGACPAAVVLAVVGADFGYRETLSPGVQAALPLLLAEVQRLAAGDLPTPE
jgi:hydrogenase maturation protease